jgi:hypothetical protein
MKKTFIYVITATALVFGLGRSSVRAADKQADSLSDRIHAVNDAAKKSGNMKPALHSISVETGVPESQVEAMHKKYSDTGVGGVLISCVLADETKKTPEYFMDKHKEGKGWSDLAREHHVAIDKLNTRLDHVEAALSHSNSTSKEHKGTWKK